jgi:hypothetical protein
VAKVGLAACAGMVAMGMRDHRPVDRLPGIDVEIAWQPV